LPDRIQLTKVRSKKIKQLAIQADEILEKFDSGSSEQDAEIQAMFADRHNQVTYPQGFTDLRDFASWIVSKALTHMAFN